MNEITKPEAARVRISKVPLLLSLIALAASGYLGYEFFLGQHGVLKQAELTRQQNSQIVQLINENRQLNIQLTAVTQRQQQLESELRLTQQITSQQLLPQLSSLISGANQSLLLFHDNAASLKQLEYARDLLVTTGDPAFSELKINLSHDLANLQAQNNYDNTMLASQLKQLTDGASVLKLSAVASPERAKAPAPAINNSNWQRFWQNITASLGGLVKIAKTNPSTALPALPENELVLRQHLSLDLLNCRQALLVHDQNLWSSSLADATNLLQHYFIADQLNSKLLLIIANLQTVKFDPNNANLDLTMKALVNLEQLHSGK